MTDLKSFESLFADFNTYPKKLHVTSLELDDAEIALNEQGLLEREEPGGYVLLDADTMKKYDVPDEVAERIPSTDTFAYVEQSPPRIQFYERVDVVEIKMSPIPS